MTQLRVEPQPPQDFTLAAPMRCGACLYDLTGLPNGKCPECGSEFGEAERSAHARLAAWQARRPRLESSFIGRSLAVTLLVGLIALAVEGPFPSILAAVAMLTLLAATGLCGLACSLACRRWQRGAFVAIWLAHAWWLHLPWLAVPIGVGFVAVLGLALHGFPQDAGLMVALMLLQPWCAIIVVSLIGFLGMIESDSRKAGIARPSLACLVGIGAFSCLIGSVVLGLAAGAHLVARLLELP
ncbi:MAG: hypothetical protein AB7G11_01380 [Phycisphaerales bacterium]